MATGCAKPKVIKVGVAEYAKSRSTLQARTPITPGTRLSIPDMPDVGSWTLVVRGRLVRKGGEVQPKFKYYCRFAVYIRAINVYGMAM